MIVIMLATKTLSTAAAQPAPTAVLTLRDATVQRAHDRATLLSIASLVLHAGDRVIVTGASGSGKSLLLRTLIGRPPAGLVLTADVAIRPARISIIPQRGTDALHPLLTLGSQLRRVTRATAPETRRALDAVGMSEELQHKRPAELSGGQAQRGAIALAALNRAALMIADEPTSALDHATRDLTLRALERSLTADTALVVSTHDEALAVALATRRFHVTNGTVEELHVQDGRAT